MLEPSWVGLRVTVRRVVERRADAPPRFADVVGELVQLGPTRAVLDTRTGLVEVELDAIAAAKPAPPSTRDELELEAVLARGWRPAETAELGRWLLRANDGFTGRANSVLPLGAPGLPLDAALEQVREWYAARSLPARFQVPVEARRLLDSALGERGWEPSVDVHVMTSRVDRLLRPRPGTAPTTVAVTLAPTADDGWFARYREGAGSAPAARSLLQRHDRVRFAAVREGGQTLAVGRGTVDDGWLGVTAVEVAPDQRRQGLGSAIMRTLLEWGAGEGATHTHLQVSADNAAALSLYQKMGYWVHHDYRYRTEP